MKFKNYEEYLKMRNNALEKAKKFLEEGKLEEAEAESKEVETLDNAWENFATAQANLNALEGRRPDHEPLAAGEGKVNNTEISGAGSDIYKNAFANYMMGKALTEEEKRTFENVNPGFTNSGNTTKEHAILIPETVRAGIWQEIGESHPIFADLYTTNIEGDVTIIKDDSKDGDAEWYEEKDEVKDDDVAFGELNLKGCELSKCITVSWKLKKMAIEEFLAYITQRLAAKMGNAIAKAIVYGKGQPAAEETFKAEPKGIATTLGKETGTPQVVAYSGEATYDNIIDTVAKVKSGYKKIMYANSMTVWGQLAKIKDQIGRPLFVPDVNNGGVGNILGITVKQEDAVLDGTILVGDVARGYVFNVNENISMYQEDHIKKRTTDYMAYAIADGGVLTSKAFAVLQQETVAKSAKSAK